MGRNRKTAKTEQQAVETPAPVETEQTAEAAAETEQTNRSVVPMRWVRDYAKRPLKGTCSDALAYKLEEATKTDGAPDIAKIRALGEANGIDVEARWGARNIGMKRMNLGNVLRGRIKRNEPVHGLE